MRIPTKTFIVAVALAAVAAGCSSSDSTETTTSTLAPTTTSEATTTTEAPTTTTTATTTTTTLPEIAPTINGLPAEEGTEERRVVAVKIDNHPKARPQSGIQKADAAYEILVEGGLTRFIALFHQSDSDYVGPNRSGRPTDSEVLAPLGGPFQISGAQSWVKNIFKSDGVNVVYDNGVTTFRMSHRNGPHNLYTSTPAIREYADDKGWPDEAPRALYIYGYEPTETIEEATTITFDWSNQPNVVWTWDGEQYLRFNGTTPHEWVDDREGVHEAGQIAFDALVVIKGDEYTARDPSGRGSSVPATHTTGSGEALVFHSGGMVDATWERETVQDMIRLVDGEGNDLILPPGRIWTSVFPDDRTLTWE